MSDAAFRLAVFDLTTVYIRGRYVPETSQHHPNGSLTVPVPGLDQLDELCGTEE